MKNIFHVFAKKYEKILHDFAKRKMKKILHTFAKKIYRAVNTMFRHHIHVLGTQNTDQLRLKSLALCEIQANFLYTATKNDLVKLNPSLRRKKRRKIFGQWSVAGFLPLQFFPWFCQ